MQLADSVQGADPAAVRDRCLIELLYGAGLRIGEVGFDQWTELHGPAMAHFKIVKNHRRVAGLRESFRNMRADVARSTRYQNLQAVSLMVNVCYLS